jgi:peptidoglycan/xylan/chitin deacetylase (PgdA/CDA1 family)
MHVSGPGYAENDLVAFAEDLETIHRLGLRVVPVSRIVGALLGGRLDELRGCLGLTFDDGCDFDWHDLPHPAWGPQRGMAHVLADFRAKHGAGAQPQLHATSFVIVSPEAREELDRTCLIGCRWWNDDWWAPAERSGLVAVESHSWDHNHHTLAQRQSHAPAGTFDIARAEDAERQVVQAARWLRKRRERDGPVLFAYPYGLPSDYLADSWLPAHGEANGISAAFSGDGKGAVTAQASRWRMPRFIFRNDWKQPGDLEALLRGYTAPGQRAAPAGASPAPAAAHREWRDHLRTWEVHDARVVAGDLFKRSFGHEIPTFPRHFVLVYSPPPEGEDRTPRVVAYVHQTPFEEMHLTGGMCVDAAAYRRMPRWLYDQVREAGGLATIVTRDSMESLGASPAAFGHVGEPRARAADLRTGFVDTPHQHLMVLWRRELPQAERERLIERARSVGPF